MENTTTKIELKPEPTNTNINTSTGALTQVVKDKKKKKKKLTAKERAQEKLDKECEKLMNDSDQFNNLLISVSYWLKEKEKIAFKLFNQQCLLTLDHEIFLNSTKKTDTEPTLDTQVNENETSSTTSISDCKISYQDFKIVTADLNIPCTNVQLHVICKLLDPEGSESIDFRKFTPEFFNSLIRRRQLDGVKFINKTERTKHLSSFTFKKELTKHFATQYPLYIKLDLRLVTFGNDKEYRGHIRDEIVYSHLKVISLVELVKERLDIVSNKISIYQDMSKTKASYLEEGRTLESYGFNGGDYNDVEKSVEKLVLYFDYRILDNDDPILNCDFYFHDYKLYKKF